MNLNTYLTKYLLTIRYFDNKQKENKNQLRSLGKSRNNKNNSKKIIEYIKNEHKKA